MAFSPLDSFHFILLYFKALLLLLPFIFIKALEHSALEFQLGLLSVLLVYDRI